MTRTGLILIPLIICFLSCSQREHGYPGLPENDASQAVRDVAPENYMAFVKEKSNNLILSKEIGDFSYTARFIPAEYMVLSESLNDSLSEKAFLERAKEMSELQYFHFFIQNRNFSQELLKFDLSSESEYASRIEYFSFKMQDDIKLIEGKDTLSCELFHFERTYDFAPYLSFTVAFRNDKRLCDKTISFNDMIFKNGKVNITFDRASLTSIPKVKFI